MPDLEKRYPDIAFQLQISPQQTFKAASRYQINPQGAEVIYLFGISEESYLQLKEWLSEKKEHALVFIEENLGAIRAFLKTPHAKEILDHPQVHLKVAGMVPLENVIEELAQTFPTDRLKIYNPKKRKEAAHLLERSSVALSALYSDVLYGHRLFQNLVVNFPKLLKGFNPNLWKNAFKGIPALICGAGPSLENEIQQLKALSNHALIIAGGSSIAALAHHGISAHLNMALDPNREELRRLQSAAPIASPLLACPRLQEDVLPLCSGPIGYLYSATGGLPEEWLRLQLGLNDQPIGQELSREAFSVTTLAIAFAEFLGCNPVITVGVDLAKSHNQRYASGVDASPLEASLLEKPVKRGKLTTSLKWIMEADAISDFAMKHPDTQFFNASSIGLAIPNLPYISLRDLKSESYSIQAKIEELIASSRFSNQNLHAKWQELHESVQRSLTLIENEQNLTRREFLLGEEPAYHCFLQGIDAALQQVLKRYFVDEESRSLAKWKELREAALRLKAILHTQLACCVASEC